VFGGVYGQPLHLQVLVSRKADGLSGVLVQILWTTAAGGEIFTEAARTRSL